MLIYNIFWVYIIQWLLSNFTIKLLVDAIYNVAGGIIIYDDGIIIYDDGIIIYDDCIIMFEGGIIMYEGGIIY